MKSNSDKCHLLIITTNPVYIRVKNIDIKNSHCERLLEVKHCVKSVRIRSYSGAYFPTFGLNTERYYIVSLRMHSECGEIRTRITPNTDTFYAVKCDHKLTFKDHISD